MYQVTTSYFLPWESLSKYPDLVSDQDLVTIDVRYDRTALGVDDTVDVRCDGYYERTGWGR